MNGAILLVSSMDGFRLIPHSASTEMSADIRIAHPTRLHGPFDEYRFSLDTS